MNRIQKFVALSTVSAFLSTGMMSAQYNNRDDHHDADHHDADHHDDHGGYVRHQEWKKGYHMRDEDWHRAQPVDYRTYHLRTPPRGYEWRQVDGNYVLAAVATGIIASTIIASTYHH